VLQWHYGSVDFDSVAGQGTTFRLCLPSAESPNETNGATSPGVAQPLGAPGD
jgi:hypothetical protein